MSCRIVSVLVACTALALVASGCGGGADKEFISIGTGSETGVYFAAGSGVARLINQGTAEHGIKASSEKTDGSVYNINGVVAGDLEFGLAQSDRQYQAVNGLAEWQDQPQEQLRAICSLHPEVIHLVADAEVTSIADLAGRAVNLGEPASGMRQNAVDIFTAAGLDPETDIQAESFTVTEAPGMLQNGRIAAFFYTVGLGAGAIKQATNAADPVRLVPITGMEPVLERYPFFTTTVIPAGTYPEAANGDEDVPSIGMLTTLVTSAEVSDDTVYAVTKAIFENLEELKAVHPALRGLSVESMLRGSSAPIHPGAQRYFTEAGLEP